MLYKIYLGMEKFSIEVGNRVVEFIVVDGKFFNYIMIVGLCRVSNEIYYVVYRVWDFGRFGEKNNVFFCEF